MTVKARNVIGELTFTAEKLAKIGDRDDFLIRVLHPDANTDFQVPLSITGTVLAIWGNPNSTEAAENLAMAIFSKIGTASQPPEEGFWFDSYNSKETIKLTIDKISNEGALSFTKNASSALFIRALGAEINTKIQDLDRIFSSKFNTPFFISLEDISEPSRISNDLTTPATNNAEFLYRICILSGIIDHINVSLTPEDSHLCSECGQRHRQSVGSLQLLRNWLTDKLGEAEANRLTGVFQMIKKIRKQYPIHDHYETANNIRRVRDEIEEANLFFGINNDFGHDSSVITERFGKALDELKTTTENIS